MYPPKSEPVAPLEPEPLPVLHVPAPPKEGVSPPASSAAPPSDQSQAGLPFIPPSPSYAPSEGEQSQEESAGKEVEAVGDEAKASAGAAKAGIETKVEERVAPPPAPFMSDSMELACALQRLRLNTDRDRLEAPLPPKATAAASYVTNTSHSYEGTRRGSVAAMTAVCEVYAEAMDFWSNIEEGAAESLAAAGQQLVAEIAVESAYNEQTVSASSARPEGRKGNGNKILIEFCCDANSTMGNVGKGLRVEVVRLYKEALDFTDPRIVAKVVRVRGWGANGLWGGKPPDSGGGGGGGVYRSRPAPGTSSTKIE